MHFWPFPWTWITCWSPFLYCLLARQGQTWSIIYIYICVSSYTFYEQGYPEKVVVIKNTLGLKEEEKKRPPDKEDSTGKTRTKVHFYQLLITQTALLVFLQVSNRGLFWWSFNEWFNMCTHIWMTTLFCDWGLYKLDYMILTLQLSNTSASI